MKKNKKINKQSIKVENHTSSGLKTSFRFQVLFVAFSIAIITFIVFSPSLKCGFTNWDDDKVVTQNSLITSKTVEVNKIFTTIAVQNDYYPITLISLAWNYQLGKLNPYGYHLWNVLLHMINTLLVFLFVFLLTKRNLLMASIVALFFGIHPMHVESVTWITERKDVLFMFFFMAGLITYLRFRDSRKLMWYIITLVLFLLSCLSKGTAVVFPFILLLIDYLLSEKLNRKIFLEKIPFFIITALFVIITLILHKNASPQGFAGQQTFLHRIIFASYDIFWYVYKLIIPTNLSAFYLYPDENAIPLLYYLAPIFLLLVLIGIYLFLRKEKTILFGLLFYFFSIILMLQIIPTGTGRFNMADRYSYLSYIGLLIVAAYFINKALQKKKRLRYPVIGLTIICAFIFCYQTFARTKIWQNSETLWTDALNKNPERCYVGYFNRGDYYQNVKKDIEKAFSDYNKAIAIFPNYNMAYNGRGLIYLNQHNYELSMSDFNKAIELDSTLFGPYTNRGLLHFYQYKYELAMKDFNKSIELNPNYSTSYCNLGLVYYKRGEKDLALKEYNLALLHNPNFENAYYNRGLLYEYAFNQNDLALADYKKALELNPQYSEVYFYRGLLYANIGKNELAISDFSKAIELDSSIPDYWINRSYAEKALGKKDEAKGDVLKAMGLGMKVDTSYLNELGIN